MPHSSPGDLVKLRMLGPIPRDSVGLGRDPGVLFLTGLQVALMLLVQGLSV